MAPPDKLPESTTAVPAVPTAPTEGGVSLDAAAQEILERTEEGREALSELREEAAPKPAVTSPASTETTTPTAVPSAPSATSATTTQDKPKTGWAGFFSSLSAGWSDISKWLSDRSTKIGDWIKGLMGIAKKKGEEAVDRAKEVVKDAMDLLWPDAPVFSFPASYIGAVDVSDVRRVRVHPIHGTTRMHHGLDIPATKGTPILLAADEAEVITSKFQETINPESGKKDGAGHYVKIRMSNGVEATFMHLDKAGPAVGTKLKKGQVLGYVGETGGATGPHIHYEIEQNGQEVDPTPYLASQLKIEAEEEKEEKGVA